MNRKTDNLFNSDMLLTAREYRGISQSVLAKKAGITQGSLSKIENKVISPDANVVSKFSKVLGFPEDFFFQQGRAYGEPISIHSKYRKKASVSAKALNRLSAEMNIRLMGLKMLLRSVELEPTLPLPEYDSADYEGDVEYVAEMVRKAWLVKNGPIHNLTELAEKAGIVIFWCDLSYANLDGVSLNIQGFPPCIFLNQNMPSDRMKFSLAHEIGHIIMHKYSDKKIEDEANSFASALLMPRKDIANDFRYRNRITIADLAELKSIWKVSMASLLFRGKQIGMISHNQSDYLWRQLSALGYRKKEPASTEFPYEKPTILTEIIGLHENDLNYTVSDLASAAKLQENDFQFLYSANLIPTRKLRLVK